MSKTAIAYGTLRDLGFDPDDPEILLELGMDRPVDWDAVDDDGMVICKRLDFVLTVDHVKVGGEPLGIHFVYDRIVRDFGRQGDLYVYVLGLRPTRDKEGRDCDRIALVTAVGESRHVRRRSWCADIGEIRICWRHSPLDVTSVRNGAFVPEDAAMELPEATDDEIERAKTGFDSWCAEVESSPGIPDPDADDASSPGIPLDDDDIEFILDGALVEISTPQDSAPIRMLEKTLAFV